MMGMKDGRWRGQAWWTRLVESRAFYAVRREA